MRLLRHLMHTLTQLQTDRIGVAVSGGADSMALCLALKEVCEQQGITMTALTVDHRLRAESTDEALSVHGWLTARGVRHEILTWDHGPVHSNLQSMARQARYQLLLEYCKLHGIPYLFTAHHQQDQLETFMMRLTHCSGVKGLGGMAPLSARDGVVLVRPLLHILPDDLKSYLKQQNQPWIEDPSNQLTTYERIRWRQRAGVLDAMGISAGLVVTLCDKLRQEDDGLDWAVNDWIQRHCSFHPTLKFMTCDGMVAELPVAIAKRVMLAIASKVRGIAITSLDVRHNMNVPYQRLCAQPFKPFTLGGCYWFMYKASICVVREWAACPWETVSAVSLVYDHRFKVVNAPVGDTLEPVGMRHWPAIKQAVNTGDIPYQAYLSLPVFRKGDVIVMADIDVSG